MQGAYVATDQIVFPAWQPGIWQSFCFIADSLGKTFKAILNNETVFETRYYKGEHEQTGSIFLMDTYDNDMKASGDITDLQIWSKKLTAAGIFKSFSKAFGCILRRNNLLNF